MKLWKVGVTGFAALFAVASVAESGGTIRNVQFVPGKASSSLVISYEGKGNFRVFHSAKHSNVIIEAENLSLPARLTRAIDVAAKGGPVIQVTPYNSGAKDRMMSKFVIQLRGGVEVASSDSPGLFSLDIKPKAGALPEARKTPVKIGRNWSEADQVKTKSAAPDASEEVAKKLIAVLNAPPEEKVYFGDRVSFEASDASIHDVFRIVGEASELNIITDSEVTAKATYSLKDIPWDQLLDIVIQQAQLKASVVGNVVRITTLAKHNQEQEEKKKELLLGDELEPVVMAVLPLGYAKAEDMKKMIDALLVKKSTTTNTNTSQPVSGTAVPGSPGATTVGGTTTSSTSSSVAGTLEQAFVRGQIEVDARSNSLVVTNTKEAIERVRRLVKELDVPLPQVLIDSKFVVATENFSRTIGVAIGAGATSSGSGRAGLGVGVNGIGFAGQSEAFTVSAPDPGNGTLQFQLGAGLHGNLRAALDLAELNGASKTIASPRVIVNNKTSATIQDGTEITVLIPSTVGGTAATETVSASLNLTVTPQITSAGSVLLDVQIANDAPTAGGITSSSVSVSKKSIDTEVLVESGATLVLGGVYQFTSTKSEQGIPLLKDLPFLGQLFRTNSDTVTKSELMVFITPQILETGVSTPETKVN